MGAITISDIKYFTLDTSLVKLRAQRLSQSIRHSAESTVSFKFSRHNSGFAAEHEPHICYLLQIQVLGFVASHAN